MTCDWNKTITFDYKLIQTHLNAISIQGTKAKNAEKCNENKRQMFQKKKYKRNNQL